MEALLLAPVHPPFLPKLAQRRPNEYLGAANSYSIRTMSKRRSEISPKPPSPSSSENGGPFQSLLVASALMRVSANSLQYPAGYVGAVPDRSAVLDGDDRIVDSTNYLTVILESKVYHVAIESPLDFAQTLSKKLGVKLLLKREDLQSGFSFKIRGAYNMMTKLEEEELERDVICSSARNHAQGVALAADRLGCDAVIVMPFTTPEIKWRSVKELGATVVLVGGSYDEAHAKNYAPNGRSIACHICPVGGDDLIAGIAAYVKSVAPKVKIIGVEPSDANAMALSLHHSQRVVLDKVRGFGDCVAVKEVGEETFRLCKELVDGVVLVSRDAVCAAIKDMFVERKRILEPAGALALAGAEAYCRFYKIKGENVVAITSGANMSFADLRMVTKCRSINEWDKYEPC